MARSITIRVAERLAKYICSLMRKAATLATPETECLLYGSYWFRPILSELIGAATETAPINRNRAPSGPVKVSVPTQPQERPQGGVSLTSGVAALLAWFPASWAFIQHIPSISHLYPIYIPRRFNTSIYEGNVNIYHI